MKYIVNGNGTWYNACTSIIKVMDSSGVWRQVVAGTKAWNGSTWDTVVCAIYTMTAKHVNMGYGSYDIVYYQGGVMKVLSVLDGQTVNFTCDGGTEVEVLWDDTQFGMVVGGVAQYGGQCVFVPTQNTLINSVITKPSV